MFVKKGLAKGNERILSEEVLFAAKIIEKAIQAIPRKR
jgi:hypothetical protein